MAKGHNFVKNMTIKNPKSHAHLQVKFSNQFDQICGRSCGNKVEVSMGHNSRKNGQNKNQNPHTYLHIIRKQSIKFQFNPTKDVRGVAGTRVWKDVRVHTWTDEGHFYSPLRLRQVTIIYCNTSSRIAHT